MSEHSSVSWLEEQVGILPDDVDVALVLRHAEREDIHPRTFGVHVPLTACGVTSAERLGAALSRIRPQIRVAASPVPRCASTARAILRGAGAPEEVTVDWRLGDPGPFVVDEEISGALFLQIGILDIVRHQLTGDEPPAGMKSTPEGVHLLLGLAANDLGPHGRMNIHVTHDGILAVLVAYLYRLSVDEISWPGYLDGLVLWRHAERLHFIWRGLTQGSYPFGG
ncbi:MAG: histidine phosphatase family protein [Dehalococcoidia bacterium]|nr:histidine phosphatase family protein [Dehalococcoidia bacterium]